MKKFFSSILLCFAVMVGAQTLQYPTDTINGEIVYRYTVERSIGLYRISKMFDVSQEDLIRYNPQLKERGVQFEEVLLIPAKIEVAFPMTEDTPVVSTPSFEYEPKTLPLPVGEVPIMPVPIIDQQTEDTVVAVAERDTVVETKQTIKIALLLPLQVDLSSRQPAQDRFFDFYQGVLLAAYDMQSEEQQLEIDVYDIGKSNIKLENLIESGKLDEVDGIVGPAFPPQVSLIAKFAGQKKIPVLVPFTDNVVEISTNPYLLRFNVSAELEASAMMNYLEERRGNINCVLMEAADSDIPLSVKHMRDSIVAHQFDYTTSSVHKILTDSLAFALKDGVENVLVFNTEKASNLQVLMPRVMQAAEGKRISLLAHYSWQKDKIRLPLLFTTEFATAMGDRTDHYEQIYNLYFGNPLASNLPRYDLLGYDLARFFVQWLNDKQPQYEGLQSVMNFEKIEDGGYINTSVQVMRQETNY